MKRSIQYLLSKKNLLIVLFLSCLILAIFFTCNTAHSIIKFSIPDASVPLDTNCTVPINLISNDPEGFGPWNLTIEYDANYISFIECDSNTLLLEDYIYFLHYEVTPGKINVLGVLGYDPVTSENLRTIGTGTFLKLIFATVRKFPMLKTVSEITVIPKDSDKNSLLYAVFESGSVEILPNIMISTVVVSESDFVDKLLVSIYGQGFTQGAIPAIGYVQGDNTIVNPQDNMLTTHISKSSLPLGLLFDVIVSNPNGDFGVKKRAVSQGRSFKTGMNLFGYPTTPHEECDSSFKLLSYLSKSNEELTFLKALSYSNSVWQSASFVNGFLDGTDFPLSNHEGYIIYSKGPSFSEGFPGYKYDIDLEGQFLHLTQRIKTGLNIVSLHPLLKEGLFSDELVRVLSQKTGGYISMSGINPLTAKWKTNLPFFNSVGGKRLLISNSDAYVIYHIK